MARAPVADAPGVQPRQRFEELRKQAARARLAEAAALPLEHLLEQVRLAPRLEHEHLVRPVPHLAKELDDVVMLLRPPQVVCLAAQLALGPERLLAQIDNLSGRGRGRSVGARGRAGAARGLIGGQRPPDYLDSGTPSLPRARLPARLEDPREPTHT